MDLSPVDSKDLPPKPLLKELPQLSLLEILEERQRSILSRLPKFAKLTIISAAAGFIVTFLVQWLTHTLPPQRYGLISLRQPTLGSIIASILSLFSVLVMWLFVVWSLAFIPFIAYHAYRSSQVSNTPLGTKAFRWIQLYASTFLPMAIFAVAWNSTPGKVDVSVSISSLKDMVLVILGAALISALLWGINRVVPTRLVAVRLSLLSSLLYASLFLAYGMGFSLASYSTLFGILFYLTFGSEQIEEMGRRVAFYDIDPKVADRLSDIAVRRQELRSTHDEIRASEMEAATKQLQRAQELRVAQIENDASLSEQLGDIHKAKTDFNRMTNEALLTMFNQKYSLLKDMYGILSKELSDRTEKEIPLRLETLKASTKDYTPKDLYEEMNRLIVQVNSGLEGLPESLEDLRNQMLTAVKEIEKQTQLLADEASSSK